MQFFKSKDDRKKFLKLMLKIVLALIVIQLLRAIFMGALWFRVQHPPNDLVVFQIFNGMSLIIVGMILLLYFKPSLKDLSLNWEDIKPKTRNLYILGISVLVAMALIPYTFAWETDVLVMGIVFGILTPAFEEFLFRGYIWNRIQESVEMVNPGFITWFTVTVLFSLWHLGYIDVFLIHPMALTNIPMILLSKMIIGLVLGTIVGLLRLKTGKTYTSFIFHGFWNVFAP
ncbi:CPBP intramembrane metalloprotease [anaerobic digester metagenome]